MILKIIILPLIFILLISSVVIAVNCETDNDCLGNTNRCGLISKTCIETSNIIPGINEVYIEAGDSAGFINAPTQESKTLALTNVNSDGSIIIDVDGVSDTISPGETKTVNNIEISIIDAFWSNIQTDREALLKVVVQWGSTQISCTDTDGGLDYFTKGTVEGFYADTWTDKSGEGIEEDYCHGEGVVVEFSCSNNKINAPTLHVCGDDYICENGKCVEKPSTECTDTDGGRDYYEQGYTAVGDTVNFDACKINNEYVAKCSASDPRCRLSEYYCDDSRIKEGLYTCPFGCNGGACVKGVDCTDSDDGENYFVKGITKGVYDNTWTGKAGQQDTKIDYCHDDSVLVEHICSNNKIASPILHVCDNGCQSGVCIEEETGITSCDNSCLKDSTCLPVGYRFKGEYCHADGDFEKQKIEGNYCDNNFECQSNLCVDGECVEAGLFRRILNWFKGIFGNIIFDFS